MSDFAKDINVPTNDCISRQAAIDAIESHIRTAEEPYQLTQTDKVLNHAFEIAASCIYNLPSAQPEKRTEERTKTHSCDLVDRQAAIDAECEVCQIAPKKERGHNCTYYVHGCKEIECLRAVPSAQPEDWMERNKERILQAGMEGQEIEFRIGGRLFAIREKAQ